MNSPAPNPQAATNALLSKMSRYEALIELTGVINAASDIETVGTELARRLKYIVDVFSWRYICFEGDPVDANEPTITVGANDFDRIISWFVLTTTPGNPRPIEAYQDFRDQACVNRIAVVSTVDITD